MRIYQKTSAHRLMKAIPLMVLLSIGWNEMIFSQDEITKPATDSSHVQPGLHLVQPKETFYGLSKLYHCTINDLKELNPGMEYPKKGEYIRVPGAKAEIVVEKVKIVPEAEYVPLPLPGSYDKSKEFSVVLMIPLHLEELQTMGPVATSNPLDWKDHPSFRFIQFYQGFLLAADSLRQKGLKLELHIFDVGQELSKATKAVEDLEFAKADLIIGPFYKTTFEYVASFAMRYEIPIVNPFTQRDDIIKDNPFVVKLIPSKEGQAAELARLVKKYFEGYETILVRADKIRNAEEVAGLKKAMNEINPYQKITEIDYSTDSITGLTKAASTERPNLVIIYAENEVLSVEVMSRLSEIKEGYNFTVVGLPEWDKFEHLDFNYMMKLNAHIFLSSYINYENPDVKTFLTSFRSRFFSEPQEFAIIGFDTGLFFLDALVHSENKLLSAMNRSDIPLIHAKFRFEKTKNGGYDNMFWNIVRLQDYKMISVPLD